MQFKIGRTQGNDIVINKENISSHHANLIVAGNDLIIEDANSTNGTWVKRRRVSKSRVTTNDEILLGNHLFELAKYIKKKDSEIIGTKKADDYTDYFSSLVKIEDNHEEELQSITKKGNKAMMLVKASFLVTAVSGMAMRFMFRNGHTIYILGLPIFFGLMSLYFLYKLQKSNETREKEKKKLREHYKINYTCPSCGNYIPDSIYLMKLKEEYNCKLCKALLYKK